MSQLLTIYTNPPATSNLLRTTLGSQIEAFISLWPNRELEWLYAEGFVALVSPLVGSRVMPLIVRAGDADEIERRLA